MAERCLIDTNILVCAQASDLPGKQRAGLDLHQTRSIAFDDALIVASAQTAGCNVLFSEDMNVGEKMGAIRIANPFAAPLS